MAKKFQRGAVSLFAVIFAALLLTVITVGFIKLMVDEQQRATNNDLSQSAYDSAIAGVEDAKRAIRKCQENQGSQACAELSNTAKEKDCNVVARVLQGSTANPKETIIRSSTTSGESFDQAYTCVNISTATDDYLYSAQEGTAEMIPLKAKGNFNQILVEWFTGDDIAGLVATAPGGSSPKFPPVATWGVNAPPVMRAQVITPGASFTLSSLDGRNASQTVVVRPSSMNSSTANPPTVVDMSPSSNPRPVDAPQLDNAPTTMICSNFSISGVKYSCRMVLNLGRTVDVASSSNAFLRLNTIYKGATVRVSLQSSGTTVKFDGVQPSVDSTGRANNLFRRVEARLKIGDDFPYPNYAADVSNSLCKDFSVFRNAAKAGSCTP